MHHHQVSRTLYFAEQQRREIFPPLRFLRKKEWQDVTGYDIIINQDEDYVRKGIRVTRFKKISSVVLVFCIVTAVITLGQNILFRTPDVYQFHFNDSRCVDLLYTSITSSQMADEIADFMNSFHPKEFQVNDFTGYDELPIFDSRDSYNMLVLKKMADISGIFCIISLVVMVSIYIWFVREDEKKVLRNTFRVGAAASTLLIVLQVVVFSAKSLRSSYFRLWGMRAFAEGSKLEMILGEEFWGVFAVFLTVISCVILLVMAYVNYRITRPPRIFY